MKTGSIVDVGRVSSEARGDTVFGDLDDGAWFVYGTVTHEHRVRQKLDGSTYIRIEAGKVTKTYQVDDKGKLQSDDLVVAVDVDIAWNYGDDV